MYRIQNDSGLMTSLDSLDREVDDVARERSIYTDQSEMGQLDTEEGLLDKGRTFRSQDVSARNYITLSNR